MRFLATVFLVFLSVSLSVQAEHMRKKLIEFGWDEPDATFMRKHAAEMEQTPFDGCVFHVGYTNAAGKSGNFTWEVWGHRAFTENDLRPALEDYRAVRFHHFKDNFLRFNVTPGNVDWFDDFSAITNNARVAAWFCREAKCKGILFDIEEYESPLFDYRTCRDAGNKSWEVYAAQARRRGREVMEAFQRGFPGATIFLTFGYSLTWSESDNGKKSLADVKYGLLAPFLDGMMETAKHRQIIEGAETAYAFRDPALFAPHYKSLRGDVLPHVAQPQKYEDAISIGFGIWLDYNWRTKGWDTTNAQKNFYTPEAFENTIRKALEVSDEYVWVYTEKPRWWTEQHKTEQLTDVYIQALKHAKKN